VLSNVQVEYETLPGWKSDISNIREFENLPENAKGYIRRVEELVGVKVKWIGVGPARDAMIEV
jgi:adenylosuccinate synthase